MVRFFETAKDSPYFTLFYLLLHTDLRRGEALALRWRHVDFGIASLGVTAYLSVSQSLGKVNRQVLIKEPKTASGKRRVALSPSCAPVLRQHHDEQKALRESLGGTLTDGDFVFSKPEGKPLDPSTGSKAFSATIRRTGLPAKPLYGLRHRHTAMLFSAGTHPKVVQERLGHASIKETPDTYSHVVGRLQEAAAQKPAKFLAAKDTTGKSVARM